MEQTKKIETVGQNDLTQGNMIESKSMKKDSDDSQLAGLNTCDENNETTISIKAFNDLVLTVKSLTKEVDQEKKNRQDQATKLQDQATKLQDQGTKLQDQATKLQDQGTKLQDQATKLHALEDSVKDLLKHQNAAVERKALKIYMYQIAKKYGWDMRYDPDQEIFVKYEFAILRTPESKVDLDNALQTMNSLMALKKTHDRTLHIIDVEKLHPKENQFDNEYFHNIFHIPDCFKSICNIGKDLSTYDNFTKLIHDWIPLVKKDKKIDEF